MVNDLLLYRREAKSYEELFREKLNKWQVSSGTGGRFEPESVATFTGMGGRFQPEYASADDQRYY